MTDAVSNSIPDTPVSAGEPSTAPPQARSPSPRFTWPVALGLLLLAILVAHGRSVTYGLLLDDFNHRAELQDADGSLESLIDAAMLGRPDYRVRLWWQERAELRFFRPLAFWLMRGQYILGDWRPDVMHAFSLAWTLLGGLLVMHIAMRMTRHRGWSCFAAVLFAVHPAAWLAPRWIACQNELMATAFMLAGLLAYGRFSGWVWCVNDDAPRTRRFWYLVALACAIAAMGCRESAVVLPVLWGIGDLILRPQRLRGRLGVHGFGVLLLVAYLIVRYLALDGWPSPGPPYAQSLSDPGFSRFVIGKGMYAILALFAMFPFVGIGGLPALQANPLIFYGAFGLIALIAVAAMLGLRSRRTLLFCAAMVVVPLLPVAPVFASSHHLYFSAAGAALMVAVTLKAVAGWAEARRGLLAGLTRSLVASVVVAHILIVGAANYFYDAGMNGMSAANQFPLWQATAFGGPFRPEDRLFFINLPMLGFNVMPGIEEETGVRPLVGYALTFAPTMFMMPEPGFVERTGERELRVWVDEEPYFSGQAGRSMMIAIGRTAPFAPGETFETPDFTARVVRADDGGVYEMQFTFDRPLDSPEYHFFVSSPWFAAYPLEFSPVSDDAG